MNQPLIDIKNAQVYRGDYLALKNFSLTVNPGEHTAIIGPNGCGKSTLLGLLSRDFRAVDTDDSYVKINGQTRENLFDLRQHLGIVSDLWLHRVPTGVTGKDLVLAGFEGALAVYPDMQFSDQQVTTVEKIIKALRIESLALKKFTELSSGQQKRFLIARALVHKPAVLIFDEPTNSLDIKAAHEFTETMRQLADRNHTLLLVTHHLSEVIPEIKKIVLMKNGEVYKSGSSKEILTSQNLSQVFEIPAAVFDHQLRNLHV